MRVTFVGLVLAAAVFLSGETTAYEYPAEDGVSQEWSGQATSLRRSGGVDVSHLHSYSSSGHHSPSSYNANPSGSRFQARRQSFFKKLGRKIKGALKSKVAGIISKVANTASRFIPIPGARMAVKAATTTRSIIANSRRRLTFHEEQKPRRLRSSSSSRRSRRSRRRRSSRRKRSGMSSRGKRVRKASQH